MFENNNNNGNKSSLLDVLSGNESVKVDVGFDLVSSLYLGAVILMAGTLLVVIAKKIK